MSSTIGLGGERARDADPLLLPAGELVRQSVVRRSPGRAENTVSSSRTRASMRAVSQPSSRGTVAMFSATVRCGNSPYP